MARNKLIRCKKKSEIMLTEVSKELFRQHFLQNPHPFISEEFIDLVKHKTDKVVRLIESDHNVSIGLLAGINDGILCSPFSAPFGGFHFIYDEVVYEEIFRFIAHLKDYAIAEKLKKIQITLPSDIYCSSINAKCVNAFVRLGYTMNIPDIVNWINLNSYNGKSEKKPIRKNINRAIRNNLTFSHVSDEKQMIEAYKIIYENRKMLGREIHMNLSDLQEVNKIFPVDYFLVKNIKNECLASAIIYRGHQKIIQAIFWGDIVPRTQVGVMDFLVMNLFNYYKNLGFDFIYLGRSSIDGIPNEGLIRFKEWHNCTSSLKFTFTWNPEMI